MITCHQCGSEVTENDAFCPYCGISLKPIEVPSEADEFASTIIMSPEEASSQQPVDKAEFTEEPEVIEATEIEPVYEDYVPEPAIETQPEPEPEREPDYSDIPTPPALEALERESGETGVSRVELSPVELAQPEEANDPVTYQTSDEALETEVTDMGAGSESVEEPGPEEPETVIQGAVPEATAPPIDEPKISRPDEVLELPEPNAGASRFDSVRIIDDRYTPTGVRSSAPIPIDEQHVDKPVSDRISRSHTSSGIGMVDTDGRRAVKLKPLEEGTLLNSRYEIVRKIGGGGMGAVYLASDNNLGGVLRAVKEMVQAHIEEEQQAKAIEDFKRESTILSQLDHPSIPTIYDYFFDSEECRFYLVMKYISGGDLSARLRAAPEGKIDEKSVTEWGIQIADVLDYLHSQPTTIVYRDLKPSNIMIDGNSGRVMLIDFGIARSINQKQEKGVTAVGTMGYAPPELFSGNVEPRSDIYSLGSTMFHLLTGADPQSNPLLIFDFQKNPRPRQINPQLSDQIERFIMRAVEYNASARFESAAEVRELLTEHLANLNKGAVTFGVRAAPESISLANQPVFCGFCGQRIVATDLFCAFCGAKQPIAQQGVHSEIYGRTAVTARLVVEGTSELESPMFSLDKGEILIGRRDPMSNIFPEVDLSKYDPQTKISRRHARIWREGNTFLLEDLGSSNGTVLVPIVHESFRLAPRQPHALTNGDKIRVGDTTLHFVVN
jgi:tRNA A-37 threonylcarbamoyl transferase component Bud32